MEADRDAFDVRAYDMAPGDAIFFDFLTVHGAPGPLRRLTAGAVAPLPLSARGSARVTGVAHVTALQGRLQCGWRRGRSVMDDPLFPVVWPRLGA